jgi:hypothetical protein
MVALIVFSDKKTIPDGQALSQVLETTFGHWMEGRGLAIEVEDERPLPDIKRLLILKYITEGRKDCNFPREEGIV